MLKNSPSTDTSEEIIDLTEIIQKGRAPLQSKAEVDFDSALSDLMGKVPAVKMQETPELEELLSGIDEVAKTRSQRHDNAEDDEDIVSGVNLSGMDDVDSLVNALERPALDKTRQPAEDVDALLDSLMDDIEPPSSSRAHSGPEISEADLDELLDTIEQESTGKDPKGDDDGAYSMDDLLSGLDKVHKNAPKGSAAEKKTPDNLDDLLSSLDDPEPAPKAAPKPKASEKIAPDSLDDLLSSLDDPKPAPELETPDSLDDLLSSLDDPKPAPKSAPKSAPKPESPEKSAQDSLDDLLSSLDAPKPAPAKADSISEQSAERVDFGDLGAMLDSDEPVDELQGVFAGATPEDDDSDDTSVMAADGSFDADDLADLDSLFTSKESKAGSADSATQADSANASDPADTEFLAAFLEEPRVEPEVPAAPAAVPLAESAAEAATANVPSAAFESLKSDVEGLLAKVQELETAVATPVVPDEATMLRFLEPGSPIHARLLDIVREAMAESAPPAPSIDTEAREQMEQLDQRLADLEGRVTDIATASTDSQQEKDETASTVGQLAAFESRLSALETMLTQVAADAAAAKEGPQDSSEALESIARRVQVMEERQQDLGWEQKEAENPLAQRLDALEARPYVPLDTIQNAFDQMGAQLNGPLQQFQNRITALEVRFGDNIALFAEELVPLMSESIDRAAADSAARALREELAAMLGEDADDAEDGENTEDFDSAEDVEGVENIEVAKAAEDVQEAAIEATSEITEAPEIAADPADDLEPLPPTPPALRKKSGPEEQ